MFNACFSTKLIEVLPYRCSYRMELQNANYPNLQYQKLPKWIILLKSPLWMLNSK